MTDQPRPYLLEMPADAQRKEPWANGAGTTTVILREPDSADWTIRVSVALVDHEGPFSELPDTRRALVPLDAPMTLRFPDGRELIGARLGTLQFAGTPAPTGVLPEGPTRDFNLMLRGSVHGEALPRTLVDTLVLPGEPGVRWLVCLVAGSAAVQAGPDAYYAMNPGDAALVLPDAAAVPVRIEGAGEIVLVKLYA